MKLLRHTFGWIILLLLAAPGMAEPASPKPVNSVLPAALSVERYREMIAHSPFAIATEAAPQVAAVPGFAKDLILTGAVRLSDGEYITLASKDPAQPRFSLKTGESYNGISLVSVAWSDAVGRTKATLKSGNEFGIIGFDEALINSNGAAPSGPIPFNPNGQPVLPPGVNMPYAQPSRMPGNMNAPMPIAPPPPPMRSRRIIQSVPAGQ